MPVWQFDNELGFTRKRVDFSDDLQRLTKEGVMRSGYLNALFVSAIQYRILLATGTNGTSTAASC
jgi:hypothetical protein